MKKTKKLILIIATMSLAVCAFFGAAGLMLTVNAENASEIKEYTVSVATYADSAWNSVMSRLPVSEGATSVTLEYTVLESSGNPFFFGVGRGRFANALYKDSNMALWWGGDNTFAIREGAKYSTIYYLDNPVRNGYTSAVDKDGENIALRPFDQNFSDGDGNSDHFGLCFASTAEENRFTAKLKIRVYDDKGKDLQLTEGGSSCNIELEGVIGEPVTDGMLMTGSMEDTLLCGSSSNKINNASNNENYFIYSLNDTLSKNLLDDANVKALGSSDGNALRLEFGVPGAGYYAIHRVKFGRKIKYSDLKVTDSLSLKMYQEGNPNIFFFSFSEAKRNLEEGLLFNQTSFGENNGFTLHTVGYEQMAKLVDSEGYISGLTILSGGNTEARLYLDGVSLTRAVAVNFYDGGELIDAYTVRTGASLASQIEEIPTGKDKSRLFVGWSTEEKGEIFDMKNEIYDSVNFYAVYKEEADLSGYVGVYYNAEDNVAFELKADKTVVASLGDFEYKTYIVFADNVSAVLFDGKTEAAFDNGVITVNGKAYIKVAETVTVTFVSEGKTVKTVTLPKGAKVSPEAAEKSGYTFNGWYKSGANVAFDFNTVITESITLEAKFTFNEPSDYGMYAGWYYNSESENVIILSAEKRIHIKAENFEDSFAIGEGFKITTAKGKEMKLDGTTIVYGGKSYVKLASSYKATFDTDGGSAVAEVILNAANGYVLDLTNISAPEKEGYTFKGWKIGTETVSGTTFVTKNVTLTAVWEQNAENSSGCKSGITGLSSAVIMVVALASIAIISIKKKKD